MKHSLKDFYNLIRKFFIELFYTHRDRVNYFLVPVKIPISSIKKVKPFLLESVESNYFKYLSSIEMCNILCDEYFTLEFKRLKHAGFQKRYKSKVDTKLKQIEKEYVDIGIYYNDFHKLRLLYIQINELTSKKDGEITIQELKTALDINVFESVNDSVKKLFDDIRLNNKNNEYEEHNFFTEDFNSSSILDLNNQMNYYLNVDIPLWVYKNTKVYLNILLQIGLKNKYIDNLPMDLRDKDYSFEKKIEFRLESDFMNETEEESFNTDKYWHIIKKSFVAKKIGSYRFYISFSHKNKIVAHRWLELEVKEFINEKT